MSLPDLCQRYPRLQNAASSSTGDHKSFFDPKASLQGGGFIIYDDTFLDVLGVSPELEVILENQDYPFAHEAGIYIPSTDEYFFTSNIFIKNGMKCLSMTRAWRRDGKFNTEDIEIREMAMANGGVNYRDGFIFCVMGDHSVKSALVYMEPRAPYQTTVLVDNYHGKPFNSVNDVVVHSDGSIWFTDPIYGAELGIRPRPELPNQVYRFDPRSGDIRVVADGLGRPNGICFAPDEKTVYVTDTDAGHGDGTYDPLRPATIYAYDVIFRHGSPFLANKHLFAMADVGFPDGIKCDTAGNVYSGCGDGIHVWSPGGVLIGKIYLPDAQVGNFCFGPEGEMFILNEHKVWRAKLGPNTRGALLKM